MSDTLHVQITFLEPYRLVEWCMESERKVNKKYLRGMGFAQWCRYKVGGGKPYITGTLLRSAVLRAAEEILCLNNWEWEKVTCCQGKFFTPENKTQPEFQRKRPTWQRTSSNPCSTPNAAKDDDEKCGISNDTNNACPFCTLLGRFDNAQKDHKNKRYPTSAYGVHFSNLDLKIENPSSNLTLKDVASERILNRVDYATGKAHDYFKVWEVDDEPWRKFSGRITLHDGHIKAKELLLASLGFVDKLCGALCRIEVVENDGQVEKKDAATPGAGANTSLSSKQQGEIAPRPDAAQPSGTARGNAQSTLPANSASLNNVAPAATPLSSKAKEIVDAFKKSGKIEKARTLADVIRAMRRDRPNILDNLPRGVDNKDHHLWDVLKVGGNPLRKVLKDLWVSLLPAAAAKKEQEHTANPSQEGNAKGPPTEGKNQPGSPLQKEGVAEGAPLQNPPVVPYTWRSFCETLGNEVYRQYKENTGGGSERFRMLGETEFYSGPESEKTGPHRRGNISVPITPTSDVKEWIFVGKLKAVTPFYFGAQLPPGSDKDGASGQGNEQGCDEKQTGRANAAFTNTQTGVAEPAHPPGNTPDNIEEAAEVADQTSFRILLDKKGRYRIPRSLLRGVLRRDLKTAFGGGGCNVELGGMAPCMCDVCAIMRGVTMMDTRSNYTEPPDIRYRIRLNPYTAVVDEGALFDMEVGPEGITFPFVMRYRGEHLPEGLSSVLHFWADGMAWLGGSGSTGKGRFQLLDIEVFEWNLRAGIGEYIREKGLRGEEEKIAQNTLPNGLTPANLPDKDTLTPYRECLSPQWMEVTYEVEISSPLISADTIHALLDEDNRDAIMYEKRVMCGNTGGTETIPAVKGETFRGIIRTAVRRRTLGLDKEKVDLDNIDNHEDCTCCLCEIFGNEHEAGRIRFEDLTPIPFGAAQGQQGQAMPLQSTHGQTSLPVPPTGATSPVKYKRIDHVAIDRFHGGAEDAMKFDTYALAGSPNNPITLKGRFWIKKGLSGDYLKHIAAALADLRSGLYPIGGKTGVGYGWVSGFKIMEAPAEFKQLIPEATAMASAPKAPYQYPALPELELKKEHIYYPHYFLKPTQKVHREQEMIGHEQFHKEYTFGNGKEEKLISGKITCKLKTLSPLIIPDTENNDAFGLMATHPNHINYRFFRINGKVMIPGSEIRGMVSSVYEAITNSCFRVFDDLRYLSRRMPPKKNPADFNILEFKHPFSVKELCKVITQDNNKLKLKATLNTVEWLNELLEISNFYDTLSTEKTRKVSRSGDVSKLVTNTAEYRKNGYTFLQNNQKGNIKKLNRLLLEEIYPDKTPKLKKDIKCGIVMGNTIREAQDVYRLPLYDKVDITDTITNTYKGSDDYKNADYLRQQKVDKAVDWNKVIARVAENNRTYLLKNRDTEQKKKVLQGGDDVAFYLIKGANPKDCIAVLWNDKHADKFTEFLDELNNGMATGLKVKLVGKERITNGRIKFTGVNMVNIENVGGGSNNYEDTWDVWDLNILHNDETQWRNSLKRSYPRPQLTFTKEGVKYNIPKRCERIFVIPSGNNAVKYTITAEAREQYRNILNDYEKNFGHIDDKFRTYICHKELSDGDLVYFLPKEDSPNEVKAVMPVPISRITDDKPLGERFHNPGEISANPKLRPCIREYCGDMPASLKEYLHWNLFSIHPDGLCPACRLFGTTSYRGRVRFGFASLSNEPKWLIPATGENRAGGALTLPLLERPRPTWSIPSDEHGVPGRKFYVHHNGWEQVRDTQDKIQKTENNRTVEPLNKDNEFTFDVYFENMKEWELGLLLYSLELEPGMGHKLGMGKPLGFGSVGMEVDRLLHFAISEDSNTLNSPGMTKNEWKSAEQQMEYYIKKGFEKLKEWFGAEWHEITHIQGIRKLLQVLKADHQVLYPKLNEKSEGRKSGYTYEKLADAGVLPYTKRVENLTTPWTPWFRYQIQREGVQAAKTEAMDTTPPVKPVAHNKKRNSHSAQKCHGEVKLFKKDGQIVISQESGKDIDVRDLGKTSLKVGQKIKFSIKPGTLFTEICDIEIIG